MMRSLTAVSGRFPIEFLRRENGIEASNHIRHHKRLSVYTRQHRVCLGVVRESFLVANEVQGTAEAIGDIGEVAQRR